MIKHNETKAGPKQGRNVFHYLVNFLRSIIYSICIFLSNFLTPLYLHSSCVIAESGLCSSVLSSIRCLFAQYVIVYRNVTLNFTAFPHLWWFTVNRLAHNINLNQSLRRMCHFQWWLRIAVEEWDIRAPFCTIFQIFIWCFKG